jgi:hypothetical protein
MMRLLRASIHAGRDDVAMAVQRPLQTLSIHGQSALGCLREHLRYLKDPAVLSTQEHQHAETVSVQSPQHESNLPAALKQDSPVIGTPDMHTDSLTGIRRDHARSVITYMHVLA